MQVFRNFFGEPATRLADISCRPDLSSLIGSSREPAQMYSMNPGAKWSISCSGLCNANANRFGGPDLQAHQAGFGGLETAPTEVEAT
jgi:hypothetical protein